YFDTVVTKERHSDYAALAERKKTLLEARVAEPDSSDTTTVDPAREQFLLAQTYLLSMDDVDRALSEYEKVLTDYPDSDYAPKALYGIAWLKRYRLADPGWREQMMNLIETYPESPAAKKALEMIADEETEGKDL
ncbi:tetratricopeptide repeat protein, partial [candidate division WOR-3 bacterium]|nr:tetratricopeptide repeat protein [candidate division WOR-3 bacterium]